MRQRFSLFQSHLDLAHSYWEKLIEPGCTVIDATCGNGYDTLKLARLALTQDKGSLIGLDIQKSAIEHTKQRLEDALGAKICKQVELLEQSHARFPQGIAEGTVRLIVYNLGYLPGGDKSRTTLSGTTVASLKAALSLIEQGGAISITCYPGHPEGQEELEAVLALTKELDPSAWSCCRHSWTNRRHAPTLLLIQKSALP